MAESDRRPKKDRKRGNPSIDALQAFVSTAKALGDDWGKLETIAQNRGLVRLGIEKHLKNLDDVCGAELFERSDGLLRLSPAGGEYLRLAERLLSLHQRFGTRNPLRSPRVRVAVPNGTLCTILPVFVKAYDARFMADRGDRGVVFTEKPSFDDGVRGLLKGRYDLLVGGIEVDDVGRPEQQYARKHPDLALDLLGLPSDIIPTVAIGRKPLLTAGATPLAVADLHDKPLVVIGRLTDALVSQAFVARGIRSKDVARRIVVDTVTAATALVKDSGFVGLVPHLPLVAHEMVVRRLDPPIRSVRIGVAHCRSRTAARLTLSDDPVGVLHRCLLDPTLWAAVKKSISST